MRSSSDSRFLSTIIPTLNEVETLEGTLLRLEGGPEAEVIVVDGGSGDGTVELARRLGVQVICCHGAGRALQMNRGAAAATGEVLLFLHADTRLPGGYRAAIGQALSAGGTVAGAFDLKINGDWPSLRVVETLVRWRSRVLSLPYGDQAIFVRASVFRDLGGFAPLPIMEDFEFVRRLQARGKIAIVPLPVLTSSRRWQKLGVLRTTAINQLMVLGYYLGIPPARLARWYRGQ